MLLGATSCSDDHFDVKTDATGAGTQTIWQGIEQNNNLSDFATVLKRTRVMTKEGDTKSVQTFADFLNQPQTVTLWAPVNGTFKVADYVATLDSVERLRVSDPMAAAKLEYTVVNRFIHNHLARFNYEHVKDMQAVRLMNSKNSFYGVDPVSNTVTFNNVPLLPGKFIGSNGVMHTLSAVSPFADNIYDYLASADSVSTIYSILTDPNVDKNEFSPELSTEGAMNDNAEMVYVDSVFTNINSILLSCGAQIKNEDSVYIAIVPTDKVWDDAVQKVSKRYEYGKSYNYNWSEEEKKFTRTGNNALKLNADSLQALSTNNKIITSMFVAPSTFEGVNKNDSAAVINYCLTADSVITTNFNVLYRPTLDQLVGITPVRASNGYIFPLTTQYSVEFTEHREIELTQYAMCALYGCVKNEVVNLTAENRNDAIEGVRDLKDDTYYYFESDGGALRLYVPLRSIPSGDYKVSIMMLPNGALAARSVDANGEPKIENPTFTIDLYDDSDKSQAKKKDIAVNQERVETIVLWDESDPLTIKKSYDQLPSGYETFPYLRIEASKQQQNKGKFNALSIKAIIVESIQK